MVELKGSLNGIGLPSVVQLIGELHHTGQLELSGARTHAILAFDDGRLVAAECGEHHGLQAVAACVLEMRDAEFAFVEGPSTLERTLDLGPADLKRLMARINSDQFNPAANGLSPHDDAQVHADVTCPMLGFADDRARHYSRPTALHRCYAAGAPSLVTTQEQRDLCLGDRFGTCPRYRNGEGATIPVNGVEPPRVAAIADRRARSTTPTPHAPVPPGVAARLAAATQLHIAPSPHPESPPQSPPPVEPSDEETPERPRSRSLMLIVGGVILGLFLVGVLMFGILPALRPAEAPRQAVSSSATAVEPASTATLLPVSVAAAQASTVPSRPTPPAAAQAAVPTVPRPTAAAAIRPTAAAALGKALIDVRLAAGPPDRWVDNAPYANWSDGAYRLQAKDATRFVAVDVPLDQAVADAIVSATFRKTGGPPGGGYGLLVRDAGPDPLDGQNQEFNAYVFETGDLGEYGVWRREGDHWIDMVPWMRSTAVRSGGSPNELVVRAVGAQLSFSVNGVEVANVQDDTLQSGAIGLFVGGDNNEVALDRFNISLPN